MKFIDRLQQIKLTTKFNSFTIILILFSIISASSINTYLHLQDQYRNLNKHGEFIAQLISMHSEYALYSNNLNEFQALANKMATMDQISFISFYDKNQKLLFSEHFKNKNHLRPLQVLELNPPKLIEIIAQPQNYPTLNFYQAVYGQTHTDELALLEIEGDTQPQELIGHIYYGMSLHSFYLTLVQSAQSAVLLSICILSIGITLTLILTRRITRPIARLAEHTHQIALGQLDEHIHITSSKEINELTCAFNYMIDQLRIYRNQIEQQNKNLEQQVAQRTEELQISTIKAQNLAKQAQTSNRAKSQFLANMSHEIRTPMNSILGFTELMSNKFPTQQQQKYLNIIHESGHQLLAIINQTLDFSKIEAGKHRLKDKPFNLLTVTEHIFNLYALQAKSQDLDFYYELSAEQPYELMGDSSCLQQILTNLIGNALKFTEHGHIKMAINLISEGSNHARYFFEIIDTGIGISTQDQEQIFSHFFQADSTSTRTYGGTGLGLSIAKELLSLMGATLEVISKPNKGSRFFFTINFSKNPQYSTEIKLNKSKQKLIKNYLPVVEKQPSCIYQFPETSILVAEDNLVNQLLVEEMLLDIGCTVTLCENGDEAVKAFQKDAYDLIFMDCQMPNKDGYKATMEIREYENTINAKKTPIVALTADAIIGVKETCLNYGMNDYLSKPISTQELNETICHWLPHKKQDRSDSILAIAEKNQQSSIDIIDDKMLEKITRLQRPGQSNILKKIVSLFLISTPEQLNRLVLAKDTNDRKLVKILAHSIKSSSENLGANKLSSLCKLLESKAFEINNNELEQLLIKITVEFNNAQFELEKKI